MLKNNIFWSRSVIFQRFKPLSKFYFSDLHNPSYNDFFGIVLICISYERDNSELSQSRKEPIFDFLVINRPGINDSYLTYVFTSCNNIISIAP